MGRIKGWFTAALTGKRYIMGRYRTVGIKAGRFALALLLMYVATMGIVLAIGWIVTHLI